MPLPVHLRSDRLLLVPDPAYANELIIGMHLQSHAGRPLTSAEGTTSMQQPGSAGWQHDQGATRTLLRALQSVKQSKAQLLYASKLTYKVLSWQESQH